MRSASFFCIGALLALPFAARGQEPAHKGNVPLYNVTVIERTTKAINYAYRGGPTKIDFRGTVLLPLAKGDATVESLRGRTEIDAKFENLLPTERFGREYLTYCLWAITPEGAARNIGEIVPDSSNKARIHVTTDLDTFGLIVTAEPYAATRQPSDVVVLENQVRPDTIGKIEEIDAKYELLPRGHYTWEGPANAQPAGNALPKVSMSRYEAMLEVYEAQNAVAIARAAGAERYASGSLAKAQTLLDEARQFESNKGPARSVVEAARESAQTAEDALVLTERRRKDQELDQARRELSQAKQEAAQAQAAAVRAQAQANAAQAREQADRETRDRAEAEAAAERARLAQRQAVAAAAARAIPNPKQGADERRTELRRELLRQLDAAMSTMDTPRGVTVTIPDFDFHGAEPAGAASAKAEQIVACLTQHPDLRVEVDGFSDSAAGAVQSEQRAENVRRLLIDRGLAPDRITAHGLGSSRPMASNATESGREANRRVEVVIAGDSIGQHALWDRAYSLVPSR